MFFCVPTKFISFNCRMHLPCFRKYRGKYTSCLSHVNIVVRISSLHQRPIFYCLSLPGLSLMPYPLSWIFLHSPFHSLKVLWFNIHISFSPVRWGKLSLSIAHWGPCLIWYWTPGKPYWNKLVIDRRNKKTFVFVSFSRNWDLRNIEKWCYFYFILRVSLLRGNGT